MKLIVISDTHGQHEKLILPEGDVLIHCGDFSATGNQIDHHKIAGWMGKQSHRYKIIVPGNHDRYSQQQTEMVRGMFESHGVTMLIDESLEIEGKKIYGSPWTPLYGRWFWLKERGRSIGRMWDNIPLGLDLLITHGPPHGILDFSIYDKIPCGCEELLKAVQEKKPKNHAFGHIHAWGNQSKTEGETTFYNAAICDEQYNPTNSITVIDL